MKKILIALVAVGLLTACNEKPVRDSQQPADQPTGVETTTATPAGEAHAGEAVVADPNGFPTGDIKADAIAIANATVAQSSAMTDNKVDKAEQKRLQEMFEKAAKYYDEKGQATEFSKLVSEEMTKQLTALKAELDKQEKQP